MRRLRIPNHLMGTVLLVVLLLVLVVSYRPAARPALVPQADGEEMRRGEQVWPEGGWPGDGDGGNGKVLRVEQGVYADGGMALEGKLERTLDVVVERFGHAPHGPLVVRIEQEEGCLLNGLAETTKRTVTVWTCETIAPERVVTIVSHEMVHQLAHDYYGLEHLRADLILSEGLATWGAGEYWLGGHSDFRSFVVTNYPEGRLPLATHYRGRPIYEMNMLYYEWASFVEYLLQTYGREAFDAVYVRGEKEPGSADYVGVYGKGLPELEEEWRVWLSQGSGTNSTQSRSMPSERPSGAVKGSA